MRATTPDDLPEGPHRDRARAAMKIDSEKRVKKLDELLGGKKKTQYPEQDLQISLIKMAREWPMQLLLSKAWPNEVRKSYLGDWLYHIPNGGYRSGVEAGIFKAMGVMPGVLDLFCMIPTTRSAGMYMELKAGDGKLTDTQQLFRARAQLIGYKCVEVRTAHEFVGGVEDHLIGAGPNFLGEINEPC